MELVMMVVQHRLMQMVVVIIIIGFIIRATFMVFFEKIIC